MPKSLFGFVLLIGRHHQIAIAALSILLFLAGTAPAWSDLPEGRGRGKRKKESGWPGRKRP
ncbi:hypothetical protein ACC690_37140, partial [Rhizobium johnstonii]